jgi:cytochrome c1
MVKPWGWIAVASLSVSLHAGVAMAEEGVSLPSAGTDINNIESLQRGARNYMSYCSGCPSMKNLRYNRMAADLKIPPAQLAALMFQPTAKAFDPIESAMPADATTWFGKQPPDLSLIARARQGLLRRQNPSVGRQQRSFAGRRHAGCGRESAGSAETGVQKRVGGRQCHHGAGPRRAPVGGFSEAGGV